VTREAIGKHHDRVERERATDQGAHWVQGEIFKRCRFRLCATPRKSLGEKRAILSVGRVDEFIGPKASHRCLRTVR
jgi:hypothetical protein